MTKLEKSFLACKEQHRIAFIPFVVLQDPDYQTSLKICQSLIEAGADSLELGFPFSDPLLDGPTIQLANKRALDNQASVDNNFKLLKELSELYPEVPLNLLVCANLIVQRGIDKFYADAKANGVSGVLVADLPLIYSKEFAQVAAQHQIDHIYLCPPNADEQHLQQLAQLSSGFIYLVSRVGVTNANDNTTSSNLKFIIDRLQQLGCTTPIVQGFGISSPQDLSKAAQLGVAGAISGSKVVNLISENLDNPQLIYQALDLFTKEMLKATKIS